MSLSRAHQVVTAELENHFSGAHGPDDICIHICNCIGGDFEREQLALRLSINPCRIPQSHRLSDLQSRTDASLLLHASCRFGLAVAIMTTRCTVVSLRT